MLDSILGYLSPDLAVRRQLARARLRGVKALGVRMGYEAARRGHRTASWRAIDTKPADLHRTAGARLRNVARELVRNNAHATRGKQAIADGLIGHGVIPTVHLPEDLDRRRRLERVLVRLVDGRVIDHDGRENLYGLQHSLVGAIVQDGEVLVLRHVQTTNGGLQLPIRLQLVECDQLDTRVDGPLNNGRYAVSGIEFDRNGQRVAYHILDSHPSHLASQTHWNSTRWPAGDVIHFYRVDRPGQVRGFSWFAPIARALNDYHDYMDAQLIRQRVAASFAAFVRRVAGGGQHPMQGGRTDGSSAGGQPLEAIEAGLIQYLDADEDIVFNNPPSVDGVIDYSRVNLRSVAVGLGIDYSALTGDYSDQNFAGGRIGHLRHQRTMDGWFVKVLLPGLDQLGEWLLFAMAMMGESTDGVAIEWSPPIREMYDPVKETQAAEKAIQAGLTSRPHEQRRRGFDPETLDAEIAESNQRADAAGMVFTSDGRSVTHGGGATRAGDETETVDQKEESR